MKKLLALVLCIVMVFSLSATAFAGDAGTASTASGISLYPVVKQANHFYGSLTKYDIMNKVAGLFKGFSTSYSTLLKNSTDAKAALNKLVEIFNAVNSTGFDDENTGKLKEIQYPNGTSLGYALAQVWWGLGNAFVGSYISDVSDKDAVAAAAGTITGAIAAQEQKIPTVTAPTAFPVDN